MSLHYHLDFTRDKFDKDKGRAEGSEMIEREGVRVKERAGGEMVRIRRRIKVGW